MSLLVLYKKGDYGGYNFLAISCIGNLHAGSVVKLFRSVLVDPIQLVDMTLKL